MMNKAEIGWTGNIEIYGEQCCEWCNETIHNHFDCPACLKGYAGTDAYCGMHDLWENNIREFECQECNAKFRQTSEQEAEDYTLWTRIK